MAESSFRPSKTIKEEEVLAENAILKSTIITKISGRLQFKKNGREFEL